MQNYVLKQNGEVYKIEILPPNGLSDITINDTVVSNDRFSKFQITALLEGFMFKIDDPTSDETNSANISSVRTIKTETYEEYLTKKSKILPKNTKWIYNIIDGYNEQDRILYREDNFIIIPTFTWNNDVNRLHVLGIVTDKRIMTIRDLNSSHISLLKDIMKIGCEQIKQKYNVGKEMIRIYLHYPPSTWLLHVHFEIITHVSNSCVVEHCHNLSMVIQNLEMCDTYYKDITMDTLEW